MTQAKEIPALRLQLRMATRRLGMVNSHLSKCGHDPALAAEAEGLTAQVAGLEARLKEAQAS